MSTAPAPAPDADADDDLADIPAESWDLYAAGLVAVLRQIPAETSAPVEKESAA